MDFLVFVVLLLFLFAAADAASAKQCASFGFDKHSLVCSACDLLEGSEVQFNEGAIDNCRRCCQQDKQLSVYKAAVLLLPSTGGESWASVYPSIADFVERDLRSLIDAGLRFRVAERNDAGARLGITMRPPTLLLYSAATAFDFSVDEDGEGGEEVFLDMRTVEEDFGDATEVRIISKWTSEIISDFLQTNVLQTKRKK